MNDPTCFGHHTPDTAVCEHCFANRECERITPMDEPLSTRQPREVSWVEDRIDASDFNLSLTLYSGIAYGEAFRIRQDGDRLFYGATSGVISTYAGRMDTPSFLSWFLRTDEPPRTRIARSDSHLRTARRKMKGFRFVRQDPYECTISYILSVQAHMGLTKQRLHTLARLLGEPIDVEGERYFAFPSRFELGRLSEPYYRHLRFGWRSKFLPIAMGHIIGQTPNPDIPSLDGWRKIVDELKALPNTGVGLKVGKCIDLFSLERLDAVPVDTWVRKMAADWYGQEGSDAQICRWAEERGGRLAGYLNENLFVTYRELHAPGLDDRVLSFQALWLLVTA